MRLLIPVLVSLALVAGCRGREATRPMADKSLSRARLARVAVQLAELVGGGRKVRLVLGHPVSYTHLTLPTTERV